MNAAIVEDHGIEQICVARVRNMEGTATGGLEKPIPARKRFIITPV
ncbi:hypothetical protein SBBP1_20010 [Burkholderiales bacterium]|nr:hypothetical protein SBBP1_20010 [Burkholderiales bacterium]